MTCIYSSHHIIIFKGDKMKIEINEDLLEHNIIDLDGIIILRPRLLASDIAHEIYIDHYEDENVPTNYVIEKCHDKLYDIVKEMAEDIEEILRDNDIEVKIYKGDNMRKELKEILDKIIDTTKEEKVSKWMAENDISIIEFINISMAAVRMVEDDCGEFLYQKEFANELIENGHICTRQDNEFEKLHKFSDLRVDLNNLKYYFY